jgi:glycosyltransferase involved in cell wall biosynthesis
MIPLLVDLEEQWRGGQNQFYLLLRGLGQRGHRAELLTAKDSALGARASAAGICVHYASRSSLRLPAAMAVRRLMSEGRFDLVHVNESHALSAAWMAGVQRRAPLLISRRVGFPLGRGYFSRARFAAARRIIANSKWVAEQAVRSGAPSDRLTVIYEGVEIPPPFDGTTRQAARARWNVEPGDSLLGCAGVLLESKGQEWAIRALATLRGEFPGCKLLLAGEGPDRGRLERLAAELQVQDAVIFAGFVADIEAFYRATDIFVFPALFEGLGTSLLAAMAAGVPAVTYFGCALGEIVENGVSGLQVEPRNPDALAHALRRLLADPEFAARAGAAGRRRIAEVFSADRMVDETLRLYREIAG